MKLLLLFLAFLFCSATILAQNTEKATYQCLPCGSTCDKAQHSAEGKCKDCGMQLVLVGTIKFTEVTALNICDYIAKHPKTVLLDVRTKTEFEGKANPNFGTLKGAINIPIQELPQRLSEMEQYKGREILVFCSHSHRSPQAAYLLNQNGFEKVVNLAGGMSVVEEKACKN